MDCTETQRRLHAYLDQELDRPDMVAIEHHLASCPRCKGVLATRSALSAGLRRHADYHHGAPRELGGRIRARLYSEPKPRWQWPRFGRWVPMGVAAALAAVISWTAAIQYASAPADPMLAEQVIAGHARAIVTNHLMEVASSDQHTVKPWLSSKLDFSLPVPDLATAGFPLAGGRLDYLCALGATAKQPIESAAPESPSTLFAPPSCTCSRTFSTTWYLRSRNPSRPRPCVRSWT